MKKMNLILGIVLTLLTACGKAPITEESREEKNHLQSMMDTAKSKTEGRGAKATLQTNYGAIVWGNNLLKPGFKCLNWNLKIENVDLWSVSFTIAKIRTEKGDDLINAPAWACFDRSVQVISKTTTFKDGVSFTNAYSVLHIYGTVSTCNGKNEAVVDFYTPSGQNPKFRYTFLDGKAVIKGEFKGLMTLPTPPLYPSPEPSPSVSPTPTATPTPTTTPQPM